MACESNNAIVSKILKDLEPPKDYKKANEEHRRAKQANKQYVKPVKNNEVSRNNAQNNTKYDDEVVRVKQYPWDVNGPYYDDYMIQQDKIWKEPKLKYKSEYKNCSQEKIKSRIGMDKSDSELTKKDIDFIKFKISYCEMDVDSKMRKRVIRRGSLAYVKKYYEYLRKAPASEFKLKLDELDKIRAKTRRVPALEGRKPGELSYQMVQDEICTIEKTIGRLKIDYCDKPILDYMHPEMKVLFKR